MKKFKEIDINEAKEKVEKTVNLFALQIENEIIKMFNDVQKAVKDTSKNKLEWCAFRLGFSRALKKLNDCYSKAKFNFISHEVEEEK